MLKGVVHKLVCNACTTGLCVAEWLQLHAQRPADFGVWIATSTTLERIHPGMASGPEIINEPQHEIYRVTAENHMHATIVSQRINAMQRSMSYLKR